MEQNLSLYKIFHTVAGTGNISQASRLLYISQPAISKAISKLESSLNTTLFLRNSRGVTLTEEGQILYQHVSEAFDALSSGENALMQIRKLGLGHIRIGVSTTLCKYILLPYLREFIAKHPHIKITIVNQSSAQTITMLEQGHLDLGLIATPLPDKQLGFIPLTQIEDVFACTPSYLDNLREREGRDTDLFSTATFMLMDQKNMTRHYLDTFLHEQHIHIEHLLEVSTMDLLIEFTKIGLGIGGCIKECIEEELKSGTLIRIPLEADIKKRTVGFATPSEAPASQAVKSFLNVVKRYPDSDTA